MFEKIILGILSILFVVGVAWLLSDNKRKVKWKSVGMGIIIPILLLIFLEKVPVGIDILNWITNAFIKVISFSKDGINMVLGTDLSNSFIVEAMMPVIYVCGLVALLEYIGVIKWLIKMLGFTLSKVLMASKIDSLIIVASGLVAGSESPIFFQSRLAKMSKSSIILSIILGFSTTAISILPAYNGMGVPMKFLIENNILALFTGFVVSKIMCPETEEIDEEKIELEFPKDKSFMSAIARGCSTGGVITLQVIAMLVGIVSIVGLINFLLGFVHLNLTEIFGWVLLPLTKLLGIAPQYQHLVSNVWAVKIYENEFVGFSMLQHTIHTLPILVQQQVVAILQSFSNLSVVSIEIGAYLSLTKSGRVHDIVAKYVWKCLLGGCLAGVMLTGIITLVG